jgi:hypothetical protein
VWDKVRRQVWAQTLVGSLPGAASSYDGLTQEGACAIHRVFWWVVYDHAPVQVGLDNDRAAVARFRERHPTGAKQVDDYLDLWLEHLDRLEQNSRSLDGIPQPHEWRSVSPHQTYREAAKRK